MIPEYVIEDMKAQVAKHLKRESWAELMEVGGCHPVDLDALDEIWNDLEDGSSFRVLPDIVAVPFSSYDDSLRGEIAATWNLKLLKNVEYEQAEVNVYRKVSLRDDAFLLYIQAEEGPTLFVM